MLLCGLFRGPLNQLFVSAALALPGRKDCAGISGVLVNRVLGWNDLSPAPRARAPPRRPLFNVDILELALIFHNISSDPSGLYLTGFTKSKSQEEYRAKDRDRRHQQNQRANVQMADKVAVCGQRRAAHHTLGRRGLGKQDTD